MYDLITEAKSAIQSYSLSGSIGNISFDDEKVLKDSLIISNQCSDNSEFRLGGVYIGQMNISFVNVNIGRNSWFGKEITLNVTIGNNTVPLGKFTVDKAQHSKGIVSVTAYDNMAKFDKAVGTGVGTYGSAYDILALACQACNVVLANTRAQIEALPNGTQPFVLNELGDIETWRDLIYWLSVSLCSFATIDRQGRLVIRTFHQTVDDTLDYDIRFSSSTYGDEVIDYTGATVYITETKEVEYYHAVTDNGYTLNLGNNPFFQTPKAQREHYMQNVITGLAQISFNACKVQVPFGWHYDLGDVLKFPNGEGSQVNLFCIMGYSLKYNGECSLIGIPGQKDSMSKTDKNLQGMMAAAGRNEFTSYELRNSAPILIGDNEEERLLMARIASNTATKAQIHVEVNLESEADADYTQGVVTYLINSQDALFYPEETWIDGKHVLHLMYILPLDANSIQIFEVYLRSLGGTISIDRGGVWMYASGAGLVGDGKWNGSIEIQEDAETFNIIDIGFANASDSVSVSTQTPTTATGSDVASAFNIVDISFASATDSVLVAVHTASYALITEEEEAVLTEDDIALYTEGD